MKLRMGASSLDVRLSEEEVQQLIGEGSLHDQLRFGPDQTFAYRIELADTDRTLVRLEGNTLLVLVPEPSARAWARGGEVTLEHDQPSERQPLELIVERDTAAGLGRGEGGRAEG